MKKSALHYKILEIVGSADALHSPVTICQYVRSVTTSLLILVVTTLVMIAAIIPFGMLLFSPLFYPVEPGLATIAIILWLAVGYLGLGAARDLKENGLDPKWNIEIYKAPKRPAKEPGMLSLWIKARHDKFCTIVEFKDD